MPITSTPRPRNFFDHNNIGNSNAFLPLTIDGALIQGNELTMRSPRLWSFGQAHLTYSNQTADGYGAINGGLTDFSPPAGFFALDHDQRNTANAGSRRTCRGRPLPPRTCTVGSGFSNGGGAPPSHLAGPRRAESERRQGVRTEPSASVTVLNVTDRHLLVDNSLTFGGFHYNDPRQIYAAGRLQIRLLDLTPVRGASRNWS